MCACEKCGRSRDELKAAKILLDVYNEAEDGSGGIAICDECLFAEIPEQPPCVMPVRPEGYYHMPIGTFD